jgi:hypothetical protein
MDTGANATGSADEAATVTNSRSSDACVSKSADVKRSTCSKVVAA